MDWTPEDWLRAAQGLRWDLLVQLQNCMRERCLSWSTCWGQPASFWRRHVPWRVAQRLGRAPWSAWSAQADAILHWAQGAHCHVLTGLDPGYPPWLSHLVDPPTWLCAWGDPNVLLQPQLAVVGTRRPSRLGVAQTRQLASELVAQGWVITSGLAWGVDAAAHEAALDTSGRTVAVLGSGVLRVHPAGHRRLAERVAQQGVVVSSYRPDEQPQRWHFPERNRIISGLSQGVVVVQAAERSGSLITAHAAASQGKDVFAVPGCMGDPASEGCLQLIQQGAKLVRCVDDIVEEIPSYQRPAGPAVAQPVRQPGMTVEQAQLWARLSRDTPCALERLTDMIPLVHHLLSCLGAMELKGWVARVPGGYVRVF